MRKLKADHVQGLKNKRLVELTSGPRCNTQLPTSFLKTKDSFMYPILDLNMSHTGLADFVHHKSLQRSAGMYFPWFMETAHTKLREPFWLQKGIHSSVINLAYVGEPFWLCLELYGSLTYMHTNHTVCGIAPWGAFEGAEGAICMNGSPSSLKSSLFCASQKE